MSTAVQQSLFGGPIRLACQGCDTESADGVDAIPAGWVDVIEERQSVVDLIEAWWTHIGTCPDCARENLGE